MEKFCDVLGRWEAGRLSALDAAELLGMSERSFRRYRRRYEEEGVDGLFDRRLGKASSRRVSVDRVEWMLEQYRTRHVGWTVKHFHDHLREHHGFRLSYSWTKTALQRAGLVIRAPRRGAHRRRRPRKPCRGMMLHQDGSRHTWLADRAPLDLIVTLDDATSEIYSAFLVEEEGTASTFRALKAVFAEHGLPGALYTDRGSHYFHTPEAGGKVDKDRRSQVGRALHQLGIEHIPNADSSRLHQPEATPSPVSAETGTASLRPPRRTGQERPLFRSELVDLVVHLDKNSVVGIDAELGEHVADRAPSRHWASLSGWATSRTWTIRSASRTSSRHWASLSGWASGGPEGGDQHRRQLRHEPDGIGQDDTSSRRQIESPHGGVEGGEKEVFGGDLRVGQTVEQRRLAGVGVADQRGHRIRHPAPCGAVQPPRPFHRVQFAADSHDPLVDLAAIRLDLGFAGSAQETAPAALALEMGPASYQPAPLIGQVRELDLENALPGARARAENFENQPGTIDDLAVPGAFEIALLDRGQRGIHADKVDPERLDGLGERLQAPGAQIGRGTAPGKRDPFGMDDVEPDRSGETHRLFESGFGTSRIAAAALRMGMDDGGATDRRRAVVPDRTTPRRVRPRASRHRAVPARPASPSKWRACRQAANARRGAGERRNCRTR